MAISGFRMECVGSLVTRQRDKREDGSQQGLTPRSQKLDGNWCGRKLGLKDTTSPYVKWYKVWSQVSRNLEAGRGNKRGKPPNANKNVRYFKSAHGGGGPHSWSDGWLTGCQEPSHRWQVIPQAGPVFSLWSPVPKNSKRASPSSQVFLASACITFVIIPMANASGWGWSPSRWGTHKGVNEGKWICGHSCKQSTTQTRRICLFGVWVLFLGVIVISFPMHLKKIFFIQFVSLFFHSVWILHYK